MGVLASGTGLECCFVIPFLIVWLPFTVSYLKFLWLDAPSALERWAEEGGHRIVRRESRTWFRGPFSWNTRQSQVVYRVEVYNREGLARTGWVRIGGSWWPSADHIDVRWDDARS